MALQQVCEIPAKPALFICWQALAWPVQQPPQRQALAQLVDIIQVHMAYQLVVVLAYMVVAQMVLPVDNF